MSRQFSQLLTLQYINLKIGLDEEDIADTLHQSLPNYFENNFPIYKTKPNFSTTVGILFWHQKKSDNLRLSGYRRREGGGRMKPYLTPMLVVTSAVFVAAVNVMFPFVMSTLLVSFSILVAYSITKLNDH